jgi:hypothetical protein
MLWLRIKSNVFLCENQKLDLKKIQKGGSPLIFHENFYFILFDIISSIPSQTKENIILLAEK